MKVADASASPGKSQANDERGFRTEVLVRFADCDPAGIVFYPRFLVMFNNLVEDWCRDGLNFSFDDLVIKSNLGLPTVHLEVDFFLPSRLGEILTAALLVRSIGRSSIHAEITLSGPDQVVRVRGNVVLVLMDRANYKAMAIPDELRQRVAAFLATV